MSVTPPPVLWLHHRGGVAAVPQCPAAPEPPGPPGLAGAAAGAGVPLRPPVGLGQPWATPPEGFGDPCGEVDDSLTPPVSSRGAARYEFTHEILPDEESFFGGLRVPRGRRVALIFRNDPSGENPPKLPLGPPDFPCRDSSHHPSGESVVLLRAPRAGPEPLKPPETPNCPQKTPKPTWHAQNPSRTPLKIPRTP